MRRPGVLDVELLLSRLQLIAGNKADSGLHPLVLGREQQQPGTRGQQGQKTT